ncbi:hypothetical protein K7I13_13550 [Brucepastera parasyntrophica]|uniref:hypothetical protein n=1 Tax=Brucepastera parasyntrophica TaxID=2880008 RepID=UPI00210B1C5F|nr:hypothetical protein [Brucepastera parasyntrophica]ULQ59481.1 hypothetical protein K7I13_13550 [Brucepastera parasyntrophica]
MNTLTMDGNNISADAPLVIVNNGTLTINDGVTLQNNNRTDSSYGGAVDIINGRMEMSGGKITGNYSINGAVAVQNNGVFTMTGGDITANTTNNQIGGVYINGGTFTLVDGCISESTYGGMGFGGTGTFIMTGGTISGAATATGTLGRLGGISVWTVSDWDRNSVTIKLSGEIDIDMITLSSDPLIAASNLIPICMAGTVTLPSVGSTIKIRAFSSYRIGELPDTTNYYEYAPFVGETVLQGTDGYTLAASDVAKFVLCDENGDPVSDYKIELNADGNGIIAAAP